MILSLVFRNKEKRFPCSSVSANGLWKILNYFIHLKSITETKLTEKVMKLTSLLLLLQTFGCDWFKYPDGNRCIKCPHCPPGQEATKHCGNNGQSGPRCQPCVKGQTFSNKWSLECMLCETDCPNGKLRMKECTLTSDLVCCFPG